MITIDRPMYVLVPLYVNKDKYQVIALREVGVPGDGTICEITMPLNKTAMWDLNLIDPVQNPLCQHLPYHLPPCQLEGLNKRLIAIKNQIVVFLYPPLLPAKNA